MHAVQRNSHEGSVAIELKEFEPSVKILSRIIKIILEKNVIGRTALSLEANINYSTLIKHLDWLESKSLIELAIVEGKINVKLSDTGKDLALQFKKLTDRQFLNFTDKL
jgi:predicted transcriptional regulator